MNRPMQRLGLVLVFLVILLAVFQFSGLRGHFNLAFVHDLFAMHPVKAMLVFTLLFALGNLIQLPGWLFLGAAVLALGQVWGGLATYVAACVSCAFTFWVIRLVGGDALRQFHGKAITWLLDRLDTHPVASVIALRTLLQTAPALNVALALSGIRFRSYLLGTLLGLPLPVALYCLFFDRVAHWMQLPGFTG